MQMTEEQQWMSVDEAAQELGVNRSTMYYYKKMLKIEHKKFDLDRRKYISHADFGRIKAARTAAAEGKH